MRTFPRRVAVQEQQDRLMHELDRVEVRLQQWIASSPQNARWFRRDPIAAMRAAGLGIDDELMCELDLIMSGIARKVRKS